MSVIHLTFLLGLCGNVLSSPLAGSCSIGVLVNEPNLLLHESCSLAQFRSKKTVDIQHKTLHFTFSSMCEADSGTDHCETESRSNAVAVVQRGSCSFLEKSRVATRLGYNALVIVNMDPATFPFGETDDFSDAVIPTVMISSTIGQQLSDICRANNACRLEHLQYGKRGLIHQSI